MRGSIRDARNYELMTVFSPDVPEDELQPTIDRVAGYVGAAGGSVVDTSRDSPWGRRRLAYAVRHSGRDVRDGFFTLFHISVQPHRVEEIERDIKLNDRIMRYLLTAYTPRPVEETPAETAATGEDESQTPVAQSPENEVDAGTITDDVEQTSDEVNTGEPDVAEPAPEEAAESDDASGTPAEPAPEEE